jgi:ankyrin repeat protein
MEDFEELVDPYVLKPDLYQSVKVNNTEATLHYLQDKVPCTYIDKSGWTALHWASKNGNAKIVKALLENRASLPYHHMVGLTTGRHKEQSKEIALEILIKEKELLPDTLKDNNNNLKETFELMQKRRETEEIEDCSIDLLKNTPLLWAAFKGHLYIVWMLLCDGYSPNDVDDMGNSALHLAAAAGHMKVVQVLIQDGINYNLVNIYKNSPIDTTTVKAIRDVLIDATEKGASMTLKEAAIKHENNVKTVSEALPILVFV